MLSDTLFEAITEIERYQREFPKVYDDLREAIDDVKKKMDALRQRLDTLPSMPP